MNKGRTQLDSIADELAGLLGWDPIIIRAYSFLLSRNGEVKSEEICVGIGILEHQLDDLLIQLDEAGLLVRGQSGYYPVHPKLGIANLFRLSCLKNRSTLENKEKVDSLIFILASYRDRSEG